MFAAEPDETCEEDDEKHGSRKAHHRDYDDHETGRRQLWMYTTIHIATELNIVFIVTLVM